MPLGILAGVAPFLLAQDHHRPPLQLGQPANQRGVVGEESVAVQLEKLVEDQPDVVERIRTLGVTRKLDSFPGSAGSIIGRWARPP
jgi:hypothetical protein